MSARPTRAAELESIRLEIRARRMRRPASSPAASAVLTKQTRRRGSSRRVRALRMHRTKRLGWFRAAYVAPDRRASTSLMKRRGWCRAVASARLLHLHRLPRRSNPRLSTRTASRCRLRNRVRLHARLRVRLQPPGVRSCIEPRELPAPARAPARVWGLALCPNRNSMLPTVRRRWRSLAPMVPGRSPARALSIRMSCSSRSDRRRLTGRLPGPHPIAPSCLRSRNGRHEADWVQ